MTIITKHIFLIFYSLIMTLITGVTIYLLEEKIWLKVLIIWFLVVVLYKLLKKNLKTTPKNDDKNEKKNEWFYLFLDVVMATNAPFIFFVKDTPLLIVWLSLYGLILWFWAHETTNKNKEVYDEHSMIELKEKKELIKLKKKRDKKLGK